MADSTTYVAEEYDLLTSSTALLAVRVAGN